MGWGVLSRRIGLGEGQTRGPLARREGLGLKIKVLRDGW